MSSYQHVCAVLDMPPRPNEKLTTLLDAMLTFLPDDVSREEPGWLFRGLFLRRLPTEIRAHLMDMDDISLREIARRGDRLWAGMPAGAGAASVCAVTDEQQPQQQQPPAQCVPPAVTAAEACNGAAHHCCAVRDAGKRGRQLCFLHRKWGKDARGCKQPCDWVPASEWSGNGRGGRRN